MRRGRILRRCSTCGARLAEGQRACAVSGHDSYTWQAMVDVNAAGAPRRQKSQSFTSRAAAVAWVAERQRAEAAGTHVEASKQVLGDYLALWLVAQKSRIRPNTWGGYEVAIRRHIAPRVGGVLLQAFGRLDAKALYADLDRSLAPKSVHNIHICLRSALGDALEDGLVTKNAADRAHAKPKDRPEMKVWSAQELSAFLAATTGEPLFRLAATTGMRRGELLGLRWRDVDLDAGRVSVRQQYTRQGALGCAFSPPKSPHSIRDIDLDNVTTQTLRVARPLVVGDALVFCWPDGSPYEPSVIDRRFSKAVRDTRLPLIRLHDLRHTHATLLLADGVDALTVSRRLGHDSVQTTLELYGHVTAKMQAGAAARFGALLG